MFELHIYQSAKKGTSYENKIEMNISGYCQNSYSEDAATAATAMSFFLDMPTAIPFAKVVIYL